MNAERTIRYKTELISENQRHQRELYFLLQIAQMNAEKKETMKAKTIKGNSAEEISGTLQKSIADARPDDPVGRGFKPTLAFIFLTNSDHAEALRLLFDNNGIAIFGITTSQKFTEDGMESDDIIALLMDINPDHFKIVLNEYEGSSPYEAGHKAGATGMASFANPGFIISPIDFTMSGEDMIRGLTDAAGYDATVMGGVAGNPADFSGIVFTNGLSTKSGLLALVIDQDKIAIGGLAVSGWKPVGTDKIITKSEGIWIYTIDNEPALNVIKRFLGEEMINADVQM